MAITKTVNVKVDTGNSAKKLEGVKDGFKGIEAGAKDSAVGTGVLTLGVKALGLALKSAGIGLVISLFVGLGNALMSNQKVMDTFNVAVEMFNLTFKRFINFMEESYYLLLDNEEYMGFFYNRVENVTNIITNQLNFAMNNFNMGLKTARVLWNASPFGDGSTSIDDLKNLGGEMMDFAKTQKGLMQDQLGEFETFIDDQIYGAGVSYAFVMERYKDAADEFILGEDNIYATADSLVSLRNEVKLAEAEQRRLQLTNQKDAEIQRQIRDDISKTIDERIEANDKLGKVLEKQLADEKRAAQIRVDLAQLEFDQDETNIDLQVLLKNAKTELLDIEERITGQTSEQKTNENALQAERIANMQELSAIGKTDLEQSLNAMDIEEQKRKELAERTISDEEELQAMLLLIEQEAQVKKDELRAEAKRKEDEANAQKVANDQKKADKEFEQMNKQVDMAQNMIASIGAIRAEEFVKEQNELDKQLEKGLISQEEYDKASRKLEKESLKQEKKNAIFQILIDTAQGIAGAIKAGSGLVFPANLGAIASGVASVLAGIASAKAVLNQVPGGGGGGDATAETSEVISGIGGLVPNVDTINQPTLGGTEPVQAYVIENDISNSQALQEELEIQSTL